MAIRIRIVEGATIALCAANTEAKEGDLYLDDNIHHALSTKFGLDWYSEGRLDKPLDDKRLTELMIKEGDNISNPVEPLVMQKIADRPKIITIIGSTRYINEMSLLGWEFEKQGHIVLNPRLLPQEYSNETHLAEKENVKEVIDKTYLHKVAMADEIFVMNINGYIGESTRNELNHAIKLNKKIIWLKPESSLSS